MLRGAKRSTEGQQLASKRQHLSQEADKVTVVITQVIHPAGRLCAFGWFVVGGGGVA